MIKPTHHHHPYPYPTHTQERNLSLFRSLVCNRGWSDSVPQHNQPVITSGAMSRSSEGVKKRGAGTGGRGGGSAGRGGGGASSEPSAVDLKQVRV